jgi:fucose permease
LYHILIIKKNLSLTPIIEKKLRTPFILVSLLFALWGFASAFTDRAFMPKIQGMIIDMGGAGVSDLTILGVSEINFSFILPLFSFLYIFYYGNLVSKTI